MNSDPVMIIHEGKRLAIYSCHSVATRHLRKHPLQSEVIRIRDGVKLATRIADTVVFTGIQFRRIGCGDGSAGAGRVPDMHSVGWGA